MQVWQLSFITEAEGVGQQSVVAGSGLAQAFSDDPNRRIIACEVEASSHKGGGAQQEETDWEEE